MSDMAKQSEKTGKTMSKLSGMLSKVAKAAAVSGARMLISFGKQSAEAARAAETSLQRVNDIFGSSSGAIKSFTNRNRAALGMSRADVYQLSAAYGSLFPLL